MAQSRPMISPPCNPNDWPGQYVLSCAPHSVPGWNYRRVNGYHLSTHPLLPILPVILDRRQIGMVLGWVVSPEGRLLDQIDLSNNADATSEIYKNGGRWLLILGDKIFLDPAGSQPAVFSPDGRIVASSPSLIAAEDNEALIREFDVVPRDGWYPFGLTPKRGVLRLLPNHVLDLTIFQSTRHHFPLSLGNVHVTSAAKTAIDAVQAVGKAFAMPGLLVGLTAGRDSRMLLAALRSQIGSVQFCTGRSVALTNPIDIKAAKILARDYQLQHFIIERVATSNSDIEAWLDRVGRVRAGNQMTNHRMGESAADGLLPFGHGAIGELARGFYWRATDSSGEPLTAREAAERIRSPPSALVIAAAQAWLDGLQSQCRFYALDMLYLEQRVGCWASSGNLGSKRDAPMIFLLNRRDLIDSMINLTHEDKRRGSLIDEVIRVGWPELSKVPFNKPLGSLVLTWGIIKSTWKIKNFPNRVLRKIKRIISKYLN